MVVGRDLKIQMSNKANKEIIRLIQWNARSLTNESEKIEPFLRDNDILCIQETWLQKKNKFKVDRLRSREVGPRGR